MHSKDEIGQYIVEYFKALLVDSPRHFALQLDGLIPEVITAEDNVRLCRILDDWEIWDAVKAMGSSKARGPDGFTALFFQRYWPQVKTEVIGMVKKISLSDFLLKQLNHTFIALIPKEDALAKISQFHSISLCNVCYKIVSKILTTWLKTVMRKLISTN